MRRLFELSRYWFSAAAVALVVGMLGWTQPTHAAPELQPGETGVVIENVGEGSALEKAGLRVGDVLFSWERLPNPPANPEGDQGELISAFDWEWLIVEQAPRGKVRLQGQSHGEEKVFEVALGEWNGVVRPRMAGVMLVDYLKGKDLIEKWDLKEGVALWQKVVELAEEKPAAGRLTCWLLLRIGDAWGQTGQWEKAHSVYSSALEVAQDPLARVAVWQTIGDAYEKTSEFETALQAYGSAQAIQESTWGENLTSTRGLNRLGNLGWRQGRYDTAQGYWQRALEIRQELAPGSLEVATSLNNLGVLARKHGDLARASEFYEASLEIRRKLIPGSLKEASSLNNLGNVASDRGEFDQAAEYFEDSLEIKRRLKPDSLSVARGLNNLGNVALHRSDLDSAAEYYEASLEVFQKVVPGSLSVAISMNNLGNVALRRSDLDRATEYHEGSLAIKQGLVPGSLDVAISLKNLGSLVHSRGDLDRASEYLQRSLEIEQKLVPDSLDMAASLNNLGTLAFDRRDFDRAAAYHQRSLVIRQKLTPGSHHVAMSLNNLGNLAYAHGDLDRATEYFEESLSIVQKLAPGSLNEAMILSNLGILAYDRGDLDRATECYEASLEIRQKLAPGSLDLIMSLVNMGSSALDRGDLDQATEYYEASLKIQQKLAPGSSVEALVLHSLALLRLKQNQLQPAFGLFLQALRALENQVARLGGSRDVQAGFRAKHVAYYRDAIDVSLEVQQPEEAFHILERSRARSFLDQLAERDLVFSDIPEELDRNRRRVAVRYDRTLQELAGLNVSEDQEDIGALQGKLQQLQRERDDIEEQVRRDYPTLAALQFPQPLNLQAAQQALDPGTMMLSYSVGEKTTDLFVLSHKGALDIHRLSIGREELKQEVQLFRKYMLRARPGNRHMSSLLMVGKRLCTTLLEPVTDRLQQSERLLVIPDGPLHLLPFAALIRDGKLQPVTVDDSGEGSGRDWHYLVEWKPLHSVLSATVYAELKKSRRPSGTLASSAPPIQLVAFGDPEYPLGPGDNRQGDLYVRAAAERGFDFRRVPYTRREIEGITRLYPSKTVRSYLGEKATEEQAKSIGRSARILHIAAHGNANQQRPLDSYLAFSIPEEFSDERDNGLLQAWEIYERVRLDADLVVLSACKTAVGKELGSEGLIGLTRAFQYAGARTVAATLWNVADNATAELMIRFYRHLLDGKSKDVALQAAQIELIREPIQIQDKTGQTKEIDASAPYYWAAFQLNGDWQ